MRRALTALELEAVIDFLQLAIREVNGPPHSVSTMCSAMAADLTGWRRLLGYVAERSATSCIKACTWESCTSNSASATCSFCR